MKGKPCEELFRKIITNVLIARTFVDTTASRARAAAETSGCRSAPGTATTTNANLLATFLKVWNDPDPVNSFAMVIAIFFAIKLTDPRLLAATLNNKARRVL
eukprot:c18887_g1_i3.p2 GENE.c18887_g1_i3~~c18887_g1_i3.p2  ORF type:complete len:102 (+),score=10.24 c18887_g1_i3:46-351(+)